MYAMANATESKAVENRSPVELTVLIQFQFIIVFHRITT